MRDGTRHARGFSISVTSQGWRGNAGQPSCCKTRFPVPAQTPLPPLAHGTRSRNGALVQWKVPAHWQDRVPCLTAVGQLYLGNGWRPIRVQEPSVSPSRPIGWVVGPCFATHSLPFLEKADMLPTQHNCSPGLTQQNMQISLSQPLQNSHVYIHTHTSGC